jgi:hypothetical protein
LAFGGRPRDVGDYGELLVARVIGRNLTLREGCLVQLVALIVVLAAIYLIVASGLYLTVVKTVADWYAHQFRLPGPPTPTPTGG